MGAGKAPQLGDPAHMEGHIPGHFSAPPGLPEMIWGGERPVAASAAPTITSATNPVPPAPVSGDKPPAPLRPAEHPSCPPCRKAPGRVGKTPRGLPGCPQPCPRTGQCWQQLLEMGFGCARRHTHPHITPPAVGVSAEGYGIKRSRSWGTPRGGQFPNPRALLWRCSSGSEGKRFLPIA